LVDILGGNFLFFIIFFGREYKAGLWFAFLRGKVGKLARGGLAIRRVGSFPDGLVKKWAGPNISLVIIDLILS
jgi:hypothetical protein